MNEITQSDIRRLLKTFGVKADDTIMHHLTDHPEIQSLKIRIRLEDDTDYSQYPELLPLAFEISGEVKRGEDERG